MKLKDILIEQQSSHIRKILYPNFSKLESKVKQTLPAFLKRYGIIDTDYNMISYSGRIAPNITKGTDYDTLKDNVYSYLKQLSSIVKSVKADIKYSKTDEWVGFDIKFPNPDFSDMKLFEKIFGKVPKGITIDSNYNFMYETNQITITYNKFDKLANHYIQNIEKIIKDNNLDNFFIIRSK